uniref:D-aspartate oxidase n=1 Tax=Scleropages formosus TaxID=113540 RepID=A0A8C9T462_SCLFO
MHRVKVAVVGAGVVGLSTAVVIAEALPHCSVTVLADRFTPNTTSDGAAGILFASQFPDVPVEQQRRWFKRTFDHLLLIASSPEAGVAGVFLSSGWQIFREVPPEKKPYWSDCVLSFGTMTDAELKRFPQYKFGQAFTTIKCECPSYLNTTPAEIECVTWAFVDKTFQQQEHIFQLLQDPHQKVVLQDVLLGSFQGPDAGFSASWVRSYKERRAYRHCGCCPQK